MSAQSIHLKGLNGLRAIAAISVVLGHTMQPDFANWGEGSANIPWFGHGVTLFFVISGFLITYLLLKEREDTSKIKVGAFYMRRILRIWPIYFVYIILAVLACLIFNEVSSIWNKTLVYYLVFLGNVPFLSAAGIVLLVHFWSIAVEEQFYLFWPWTVKLSKNRTLLVATIICVAWFAAKMFFYFTQGNQNLAYKFFNVTRFHCMMLGAIGAVLYNSNSGMLKKIARNKTLQFISWALVLFAGLYDSWIPAVFRNEFFCSCCAGADFGTD